MLQNKIKAFFIIVTTLIIGTIFSIVFLVMKFIEININAMEVVIYGD